MLAGQGAVQAVRDFESRLISASGAGLTTSYAYDGQGRRKLKTVNGATTIFVQDPQGRAVINYAGSGGAIQAWCAFELGPNDALNQMNIATRATHAPDVQELDRRLARHRVPYAPCPPEKKAILLSFIFVELAAKLYLVCGCSAG